MWTIHNKNMSILSNTTYHSTNKKVLKFKFIRGRKLKTEIKQLIEEFNKISKKGYIKGIYNCLSSIGRTFENELNLERNDFSYPDYNGIEIKTRRTYSKSAITLINAVPDGKELFEVERLKNTYGYPYKNDKKYKALYFDAYGNKLTFGGVKYQYKLDVDRNDEKIFLCIYDKYNHLIERDVYWSFEYLEHKIMTKLEILAIVNAWTNKIDGWNYFKYYKIDIYLLKGFDKFLELIENGTIKITFKVDIHKDEKRYGKTYDHGCGFRIQEKDIKKLYNVYDNENL